jgi:small subunit ribosomal protein S2
MKKLPSALFVVDVFKEKIAVREAKKLGIPVFGMVDTNSDPNIDFPIPSNDDASQSIELITEIIINAMSEGLEERKAQNKEADAVKNEGGAPATKKSRARKTKPRE